MTTKEEEKIDALDKAVANLEVCVMMLIRVVGSLQQRINALEDKEE